MTSNFNVMQTRIRRCEDVTQLRRVERSFDRMADHGVFTPSEIFALGNQIIDQWEYLDDEVSDE